MACGQVQPSGMASLAAPQKCPSYKIFFILHYELKDKAVFTVKGPQKLNIAVRLDAAESLLRRGVKGLMFKEILLYSILL